MYDPTAEQQAAIDSYDTGLDMVLQAGAGCGKSSTLKLIAKADPRRRMLYLAFNKPIALEASRSFPSHVTCRTGHSLAYDQRYQARLSMPKQTAHVAAQALDVRRILRMDATPVIPTDLGISKAMTSKLIYASARDAVTQFCHSADPEITARHVPAYDGLEAPEARAALCALVLPVAHAAWADLSAEHGVLRMSHDHYFKLWALGRPRIHADVILLDEGQDTNDVFTEVLLAQDHAQRIAVGDSAQQIYEWRGARDALRQFEQRLAAQQLLLSQSFRFGPAIAEAANRWLRHVGGPLRLTGFEPCQSVVGPVDQPDAILCRSNAGAMGIVMESLDAGRKVALVGGGGAIKQLAWAAQALQSGQPSDHPDLMAFASWEMVRQYAEDEDGSLKVLVGLIDAHGAEAIIAAADGLASETQAELIVSTVHKSKGREWSKVRIHGDFRPPKPDPINGLVVLRREEARLAYVAVTRAQHELDNGALSWVDSVTAVTG